MNVYGFMVLRKPEANVDPEVPWSHLPRIGDICYGGVGRIDEVGQAYYERKLPEELCALYNPALCENELSLPLYRDLDLARRFLEFSSLLEVIAIVVPSLASRQSIAVDSGMLSRRGVDPFQFGGSSLLVDGLFAAPEQFPGWPERLNRDGLLTTAEEGRRYIDEHLRQVSAEQLDYLFPVENNPIEPIEVFGVRLGPNE